MVMVVVVVESSKNERMEHCKGGESKECKKKKRTGRTTVVNKKEKKTTGRTIVVSTTISRTQYTVAIQFCRKPSNRNTNDHSSIAREIIRQREEKHYINEQAKL